MDTEKDQEYFKMLLEVLMTIEYSVRSPQDVVGVLSVSLWRICWVSNVYTYGTGRFASSL